MISQAVRGQSNKFVLYCAVFTTLVVSPWFSLDPINLPKLVALAGFGLMAFFAVLPSLFGSVPRVNLALAGLFVSWLVIVFATDDSPRWQQFFGTFGRNTGFVAYLSLALVFLAASATMDKRGARRLALGLMFVGLVNAGYGLVQFFGADPIDWSNPYNRILGTLGNPNFASSLLGMSAVVAIAWAWGGGVSLGLRLVGFGFAILALFLAYESDSIQGVAIAFVGVFILGYQVVAKVMKLIWARIPYLVVGFVGFALAIMGALQKGPLASLVYQESVTFRGDYWRAGISMTKESPIFGVGLDSYGDYYREFRAIEAVTRRGPDVITNSAHNVLLDISSTGGLPLLLIYLCIIAVAMRSAYRLLSRSHGFDWVATALVAAWAAYLAQSAISINQLGLAVWGWVLPGAIIGLDLNRDEADVAVKKNKKVKVDLPAKNYLSGVAGGVLGLLISIWPFVYDASFKSALSSGDQERVVNAAIGFPSNNYHMDYAAQAFNENNLPDRANFLFEQATVNNPRDFFAWQGIANSNSVNPEEKKAIFEKMRALDPLNPSIPSE